ncbi:MAG: MATE family efflux transporter [Deltaproteobacteria bacterium]|nr:MATE family efflux transporter [Deltaproteobacteria bacterium]MCL5276290.1 MATE family efflux transporter [Deltaproteobacteria bacterium]
MKSTYATIMRLALPVMIGMLTQTFINLFDVAMVGRLGADAKTGLAALGVGIITLWVFGGAFNAISVGILSLVTRRFGEKNYDRAGEVLFVGIVMAVILGTTVSAVGYTISKPLFALLTSNRVVAVEGAKFIRVRFVGLFPFLIIVVYKAFFDATGKTWVYMYIAIIMNIMNVVLSYGMILGHLGMPRLGVEGAGISATASSFAGALLIILYSFRKRYRAFNIYRSKGVSLKIVKEIIRISYPASIAAVLTTMGFEAFIVISGTIDVVTQAATTILTQLASLTFLPLLGFGTAAATMVGQSLGSGRPDEAQGYADSSIKLAAGIMAVMALAFICMPRHVIGLFTDTPGVLAEGSKALIIYSLALVFEGIGIVASQSLFGAGYTKYVMYVDVSLHWLVFVPLSYVLGVVAGLKIVGLWLSADTYIFLLSAFMFIGLKRGKWKLLKL